VTIGLAINLVLMSLSSFRGAARTFSLFSAQLTLKLPSYSSIRQWFLRVGLYALNQARPSRQDWIYVADMTVEVGTQKCLVVLGISQARWQQLVQDNAGHLSYSDMTLLGLEVMSSSKGEHIQSLLESLSARVGAPRQIVSDQGSDLYKGIRLYTQARPRVQVSYDVTHQCARVLKAELQDDQDYQAFAKRCARSRQELQQSPLAFLMSPSQRAKARYMNIDVLIEWAQRVVDYEQRQDFSLVNPVHCLDTEALTQLAAKLPPETLAALKPLEGKTFSLRTAFEQALYTLLPDTTAEAQRALICQAADQGKRYFEAKLAWLAPALAALQPLQQMLELVATLKDQLKHRGLEAGSLTEFLNRTQSQHPSLSERALAVKAKLVDYLKRETQTLEEGTCLLAASDILESLFGQYKLFSAKSPLKQMGHLLLSLPLLTTQLSTDFIKAALESVSFNDVQQWYHQNFGQSPLAKRRQAFQTQTIDAETA
jgi:hypothetical protein